MLQAPEQAAPKPQYELVVSLADFDLSKVRPGLEQQLWWCAAPKRAACTALGGLLQVTAAVALRHSAEPGMRPIRRCPDQTKLDHAAGFGLQSKLRLDAYLAAKLPTASRARLQASIKEGLVVVNGRQQVRGPLAAPTPPAERAPCLVASMPMSHLHAGGLALRCRCLQLLPPPSSLQQLMSMHAACAPCCITLIPALQAKASYGVKPGDVICCSVLPPPPLEAAPEPLPLDIVYEDDHLLVINKVGATWVPGLTVFCSIVNWDLRLKDVFEAGHLPAINNACKHVRLHSACPAVAWGCPSWASNVPLVTVAASLPADRLPAHVAPSL